MNIKSTEFEVQCFIYNALCNAFKPQYEVRGEYKFHKCRPDISIFDFHGTLKVVVEVKKCEHSRAISQAIRYQKLLGVPCIYAKGFGSLSYVIKQIKKYLPIEI